MDLELEIKNTLRFLQKTNDKNLFMQKLLLKKINFTEFFLTIINSISVCELFHQVNNQARLI